MNAMPMEHKVAGKAKLVACTLSMPEPIPNGRVTCTIMLMPAKSRDMLIR